MVKNPKPLNSKTVPSLLPTEKSFNRHLVILILVMWLLVAYLCHKVPLLTWDLG